MMALTAGRDGDKGYPTSAEEWSNSTTKQRTRREGSSTQQATQKAKCKKMEEEIMHV